MMIEVDTALFALRMKLAALVSAHLAEVPGGRHPAVVDFAWWGDGACRASRCRELYVDGDGAIRLAVEGEAAPVEWDDLDVASQYRLAQGLHAARLADDLYRSFS